MSWLEIWAMINVIGNAIPFVVVGLILVFIFITSSITWIKQSMCKHDGIVGENMACDAICRKCGKNLGFKGDYKERYNIK